MDIFPRPLLIQNQIQFAYHFELTTRNIDTILIQIFFLICTFLPLPTVIYKSTVYASFLKTTEKILHLWRMLGKPLKLR